MGKQPLEIWVVERIREDGTTARFVSYSEAEAKRMARAWAGFGPTHWWNMMSKEKHASPRDR